MHQLKPQEEPDDRHIPKLQLEFAGDGPGRRPKVAVGAGAPEPELDRTGLPNPPWWFVFIKPFALPEYKQYFADIPIELAMPMLKHAKVPPLYRLGLGLRWGFIVADRDNFTLEDFWLLLPGENEASKELDRIEYRSAYRIWKLFGRHIPDARLFLELDGEASAQ